MSRKADHKLFVRNRSHGFAARITLDSPRLWEMRTGEGDLAALPEFQIANLSIL
jgi:hypothetical protein